MRILSLRVSLAIVLALTVLTAATSGQSAFSAKERMNYKLKLKMLNKRLPAGQDVWAILTVKNQTSGSHLFPDGRAHVEGENGEPPTTLYQRQVTGNLRPGEHELMESGAVPSIESGESSVRKYDLSKLYDLSKPGKYIVYVEVLDGAEWSRSPIATFEVMTPH